jgi:hypothetical protein
VGHLVKKSSDGQIIRWPIGEASLTPTPAEPLNRALPIDAISTLKFITLSIKSDESLALWEARSAYARHLLTQADLAAIQSK